MKKAVINGFYFLSGMFFLILAKIKHFTFGYSPKDFTTNEIQRCIEYDINIVDNWLSLLKEYTGNKDLKDKSVLELGPGSDLGIGLYILEKSAKKYSAVDVHDLASSVSLQFYDSFFSYLRDIKQVDTLELQAELQKTQSGHGERLNYICRKDFNIQEALKGQTVDVIFSNAAFEHFENIEQTIKDISAVAHKGSLFIVSIDLQTHSRWIREKDPNNVYRYPNWLYRLLTTKSSPNRVRPYQYVQALEKEGWGNITVKPGSVLPPTVHNMTYEYLNSQFHNKKNQMEYQSVWICATKEH